MGYKVGKVTNRLAPAQLSGRLFVASTAKRRREMRGKASEWEDCKTYHDENERKNWQVSNERAKVAGIDGRDFEFRNRSVMMLSLVQR